MEFTLDQLKRYYRQMLLIRRFEETLAELFIRNQLGGTSHFCIGQEACAVGVIAAARPDDYLVSNHRGHGHLLARELEPRRVFAELLGRRDGYCAGRGGSQHLCAMDKFFLGTNGITGGGIPLATGAAAALRYRNSSQIVICFFGDGAVSQGTFHESLNIASLWNLPVLYVCENNLYGMSNHVSKAVASPTVAERAAAYSMLGRRQDGMDVAAVIEAATAVVDHVRAGNGPALLELMTYRFCGHSKNDERAYRTRDEEADHAQRDCLRLMVSRLEQAGVGTEEITELQQQVADQIHADVTAALLSPVDDAAHAREGVYA